MIELLGISLKLDLLAQRLYADMSAAASEQHLKRLLSQLSADEARHAVWWQRMLETYERGLIPDVASDVAPLVAELTALYDELSAYPDDAIRSMNADDAFALAFRLEFSMIDPVYTELMEAAGLTVADSMRREYDQHVQRVTDAIGEHFPPNSLASLLARALSRAWEDNRDLATYATHDALTGLYNRHALYAQLPQWAAWAARYGNSLAVLLVDIDHFKKVNDEHGHAVGDVVLRSVARVLRDSVRASDLVVRFGGDEFAIVAPQTGPEEYRDLCARIAHAVHDLNVTDTQGEPVPLSVSIGGAITADPAGSAPWGIERLIIGADQSLYRAKKAGRDRSALPVILGAD